MIDLHMHSSYSADAEFTPSVLAKMCAEQGVTLMAVTDHNSARANTEAREAAKERGIAYLSGIEIDCLFEDTALHMLGYGIDERDAGFRELEEQFYRQSREASRKMLDKTLELGFCVTEEELEAAAEDSLWPGVWTGEMFAEALLGKPEYDGHPGLLPYREGGARSENPCLNFYWDFYGPGKPCHVPLCFPSFEQILDLIHQTRGLAVLAHPGMNLKGKEHLLEPMVKLGLDGIEAFSSYHDPGQAAGFLERAGREGLFVTCGSDFHGKTKPAVHLGGHGCTLPEEQIREEIMEGGHFQAEINRQEIEKLGSYV